MKTYLVTGGSGFIGSNFVRQMLQNDTNCHIVNLDKLTYAGNPANLVDIEMDERYSFVHGDICDTDVVRQIFQQHKPQIIINFAAETHVDRSIGSPDDFIKTDVFGVFTLLEASKEFGVDLFLQISTDEVYGSIAEGPAVPIRLVRQEETGLPIRIMSPTIFLLLSLVPATIMVRSSTLRNLSHSLLPTLLRIETYLSTVMEKMSVTGFMCQIIVLPLILSLKTENWEKSTMWAATTNFRISILRIRYWNSWENPTTLSNLLKIGRDTI